MSSTLQWLVNPVILLGAAGFLWRELSGIRVDVRALGERVARIEGAIDYTRRPARTRKIGKAASDAR